MHGLIFSNSVFSRNSGAYRIAHVLRSNGWDIEVIDFFPHWSKQEIKLLLSKKINKNTKFIGFGTLFFNFLDFPFWFFEHIKKHYSEVVTIFGSQSSTNIESKNIDYSISGWAEISILKLLKYLYSNGDTPIFEYKNHTKHINSNNNYQAYPMQNLTVIYEDRDYIEPYESLTVEFSRGCKFKCKFCNFPVLGVKGDYTRSTEDFMHQLRDAYDRFGITKYIVADETFNDSNNKIIKFADAVETLSFKPHFSGFVRADLLTIHSSQREHMLRMNFVNHYYGIESFNHESAKVIGKGMCSEKLKNGLLSIKDYFTSNGDRKYRATLGFIIGLPFETEETLNNTSNWIKKYWKDQSINPYILEIPSGDHMIKSDISINYEKYGYSKYIDTDFSPKQKEILKLHLANACILDGRYENYFIWKNKDLDFFKAFDIHKRFTHLKNSLFEINFKLFFKKTMNYDCKSGNFYINILFEKYKQKKLC
jgi:radical SAM superfamily enzyme YgiQ (UPF0313 family)